MEILLVRHAAHAELGLMLCGRSRDIALSDTGIAQAQRLAERLNRRIDHIHSSPRRRALQTASILAQRGRHPVETFAALDEIDFGDWSGAAFEFLAKRHDWQLWNAQRSHVRAPNGESMVDVQARLARHFDRCYAQHPEACIAMVSHADVIRAAVFWVIGLSLDHWQRIEIAPASVTRIAADDHGFRLLQLNEEPA